MSVLAITRTTDLIAAKASPAVALDAGYHRALLAGSILMAAAALIALRISNTRAAAPAVLVNTETLPSGSPTDPSIPHTGRVQVNTVAPGHLDTRTVVIPRRPNPRARVIASLPPLPKVPCS